MDVAVGVPQRKDRITVAVGDARLAGTLHEGILAVDVAEQIGVDKGMIKGLIEDRSLLRRAALDADTREVAVPTVAGLAANRIERGAGRLLGVEVAACVVDADV